MSIIVVCQNCKKSFQVHDKFAGRSGPCPKCKATIHVPKKSEEVTVHTPEQFGGGGRSTTGKLVLKPISRKQILFKPAVAGGIAAAVLLLLLITWAGGNLLQLPVVRAVGLLLISPVLVAAAYMMLCDEELDPYHGRELAIRSAACAAAYVVLWWGFVFVRDAVGPQELYLWLVISVPFFVLGSLTAWVSLDIEPGNGFFHYTFYLLVTSLLGWVGGLGWAWEAPKG
jgi:hypothetical protein